MFYIEKNDKPNFIERKLNVVKVKENVILVPITEGQKLKQIEKIAKQTEKIIKKNSKSKKVVLSKEIKKEQIYLNYLNTYEIDISDGRFLYELLLTDITEYIIQKKKMEKTNISILINDLTEIEFENIKELARKYKTINIVTNHIEKFKKLEKSLDENEGIIITITNNKKKSLLKSQIIINVDFPKELINKYNIREDANIINLRGKTKINKKRFNGVIVNDYEIDFRDDIKENIIFSEKYFYKDIYESELYKKQNYNELRKKIKNDKVKIVKLFLNNSEL